jgi:hypothetical protein
MRFIWFFQEVFDAFIVDRESGILESGDCQSAQIATFETAENRMK